MRWILQRRFVASLTLILACLPPALGAAPGDIPPARDLAADARRVQAGRIPLIVLYSQADCGWCEQVRREHLVPMQRSGEPRVILRQVDIDRDAPLTDFAGRATTHRAFAAGRGVRFTPVLAAYGAQGEALGEPLVGVRAADFYGAYIDRLIETAAERLRAPKTQ